MTNLNMPDLLPCSEPEVEVSAVQPGTMRFRVPIYEVWRMYGKARYMPTPEYARRRAFQELGYYLIKAQEQLGDTFIVHIEKDYLSTGHAGIPCVAPTAYLDLEVSFEAVPETR